MTSPIRSFRTFLSWLFAPLMRGIMGWDDAIYLMLAAAASAASAGYANRANNQQIEAAAERERREMLRQQSLQQESDERLRQGLAQFTPEQHQQELQQATQVRERAMAPAPVPQDAYQAATPAAPTEVNTDLNRRLGDALSTAQQAARRRATLEAYGDSSLGQAFRVSRLGEDMRRISDRSRNSSNIYPLEFNRDVREAGANSRAAANVADIIGNLGSIYARRAAPRAGSGNPPTPSYNTGVF